ncbi:Nn.00g028890.m01.CDS01 [Neocucurbitaria sp. VM-36]
MTSSNQQTKKTIERVSDADQQAAAEAARDNAATGLAYQAARLASTIKKEGSDENPVQRSIGGGVVHTPETAAALDRVGSGGGRTNFVAVDQSDGAETYQHYRNDNLPTYYRFKDE